MKLEKYTLTASQKRTVFEFESIGPKGAIPKIVVFQKMDTDKYFNLAFGDLNVETGDFNDLATSDNGDSEKVLATVVQALKDFLTAYPNANVYATGSNDIRTRLYRIGISLYGEETAEWLNIYGENDSGFEPFGSGKDYLGFLFTKKSTKL
ncbi:MAG: hypothetical protein ABIN80_31070 [Dyadobacter sp.]|uniref:DUF6934 family protein n=1 Tax=Dyadobacter sp. TaxID=1914288 RepID=UPI0032640FE8